MELKTLLLMQSTLRLFFPAKLVISDKDYISFRDYKVIL